MKMMNLWVFLLLEFSCRKIMTNSFSLEFHTKILWNWTKLKIREITVLKNIFGVKNPKISFSYGLSEEKFSIQGLKMSKFSSRNNFGSVLCESKHHFHFHFQLLINCHCKAFIRFFLPYWVRFFLWPPIK